MDFTIKFNADIANKNNSISRKSGEIDVSCALTLDEIKTIQNEPDVLSAIQDELKEKHNKLAINIEVYDIIQKN